MVHGEEKSKKNFAYTVKQTLGFDCTVIEDVSEYDLETDAVLSVEDTRNLIATEEQLNKVKNQLSKLRDELETILYNTHLSVDENTTQERINEISNSLIELEKNSIKLGSTIATKEA